MASSGWLRHRLLISANGKQAYRGPVRCPRPFGAIDEKSRKPWETDLRLLYVVPTKVFNQAVTRNLGRFPADSMFQLTDEEFANLRSLSVTSSWGGRRYLPRPFTEQGVAMLSSVLRSKRAVQVNIEIMRAFVRLRQMLASHRELARRLGALEKRYDAQFKAVFDAIRELMSPPAPRRKTIGFQAGRP